MEVAGRDFEKHETKLYQLELVDKFGNVYPLITDLTKARQPAARLPGTCDSE